MLFRTLSPFLILVFTLLASCKNKPVQNVEHVNITDQIPSSFFSFYDRFHNDKAFQIERIIFPLPSKPDGSSWLKDDWVYHIPFNNIGNEYHRSYANFENIINERTLHKSGLFEMNRRFAMIQEEWHLIYYSVRNESQGWEQDSVE